ncbi:hypothetical protein B1B_13144 [mine drainage metagenome]|uniref:Uncharacterized protein n=1 Tax=mine drainage metagenome TaxID=410659 RepID=T0ZKP5_9ZZZZ
MPGDLERGRQKIEWARTHMPILEEVRRRFEREQPFRGLTLSLVLHVEAKRPRSPWPSRPVGPTSIWPRAIPSPRTTTRSPRSGRPGSTPTP